MELEDDGATLADLAQSVAEQTGAVQAASARPDLGFVLVTRAALGTLNHTALTLEALERRGLPVLGLVVGSRPQKPSLAERGNLATLALCGVPLLGAIPERASEAEPERFRAEACAWLPGLAEGWLAAGLVPA